MASNSSTNAASRSSSGVDAKTPGGQLTGFGWDQMSDIAGNWGDNEALAGIIVGAMVDGALGSINAGSNLQYESAMAELQQQLQIGMEEIKTANQIELIGAEGAMAGELVDKQGQWDVNKIMSQGDVDINKLNTMGQNKLNEINQQGAVDINKLNVMGQNKLNEIGAQGDVAKDLHCLLYTSPSPRDLSTSRMPSSA